MTDTIDKYKFMNNDPYLPTHTPNGEPIVIGCNYHTKWQSNKGMRFVLKDVRGDKAFLFTRNTLKQIVTNINDIIFIRTTYNMDKAKELRHDVLKLRNKD